MCKICENLELECAIFGHWSILRPFSVKQQDFKKISESKKGIDSKEKGGNVTNTTEPKGGLGS